MPFKKTSITDSCDFAGPIILPLFFVSLVSSLAGETEAWKQFSGQPGTNGWRCHTIHPDPANHGPDGANLHDWDGDGDLDLFSNAEEGAYSRLYFNPGATAVRAPWSEYLQFEHGPCEDSGMGDLDGDGDIDYIANGGWVFFNPGADQVRDRAKWKRMDLFDHERRVPTVIDVDGDGLKDLVVGAQEWFRQPQADKHSAANWKRFTMGRNRWPMGCHFSDLDFDGDLDMIVPDRGVEICWYENPGREKVRNPWQRRSLHPHAEPMFMAVDDLNGDSLDDLIITGGSKGRLSEKLILLLRSEKGVQPSFNEIVIPQASGNFPKGVTVIGREPDSKETRIVVIPKQGDFWIASASGDATLARNWSTQRIRLPGSQTRRKMDNAWQGDVDGDGDVDIVTTEENGGWGLVWFENPDK